MSTMIGKDTRVNQSAPYSYRTEADRPPRNWVRLIIGLLFKLVVFAAMAPLVVPVVAEGFRYMIPYLATRLHRLPLPGVSYLRRFNGWDRLDLAMFFGAMLPIVSWTMMLFILWIVLAPGDLFARFRFEPGAFSKVIWTLGPAMVCAEGICFYLGVSQQGGVFGGSGFSPVSFIATIAYLGAMAFTALISLMIDKG